MKKLEYYGGDGWGSCHETGIIKIKYGENEEEEQSKTFTKRTEAMMFYESLSCTKAAWDLTMGAELIECHTEIH